MSGWQTSCKKHLKLMQKGIEDNGYYYVGCTDACDKRMRCDYPDCKERAYYEVFWSDKDYSKINSGSFITL